MCAPDIRYNGNADMEARLPMINQRGALPLYLIHYCCTSLPRSSYAFCHAAGVEPGVSVHLSPLLHPTSQCRTVIYLLELKHYFYYLLLHLYKKGGMCTALRHQFLLSCSCNVPVYGGSSKAP